MQICLIRLPNNNLYDMQIRLPEFEELEHSNPCTPSGSWNKSISFFARILEKPVINLKNKVHFIHTIFSIQVLNTRGKRKL